MEIPLRQITPYSREPVRDKHAITIWNTPSRGYKFSAVRFRSPRQFEEESVLPRNSRRTVALLANLNEYGSVIRAPQSQVENRGVWEKVAPRLIAQQTVQSFLNNTILTHAFNPSKRKTREAQVNNSHARECIPKAVHQATRPRVSYHLLGRE